MAKDDIKIRFFERKNNVIVWEDLGHFRQSDVHKGVAISFRTPKYKTRDIEKSVKVSLSFWICFWQTRNYQTKIFFFAFKCYIQLYRPSDDSTSDALPFEYFPLQSKKYSLIGIFWKHINFYSILKKFYHHFLQFFLDKKKSIEPKRVRNRITPYGATNYDDCKCLEAIFLSNVFF